MKAVLDAAINRMDFLESCTPGYYNNEGHPNQRAFRDGPYGGGLDRLRADVGGVESRGRPGGPRAHCVTDLPGDSHPAALFAAENSPRNVCRLGGTLPGGTRDQQVSEGASMAQTATPVDNGVNVEALLGAREALSQAPEAAQFKWRATCKWVNGTHSQTSRRRASSASAASRATRRRSRSTPIIPRSSRRRTTARRRSRSCSPAWPAASPPAWPRWPRTARSSSSRCRRRSRATWTSAASSAWTATSATGSAASR